ncbi:MAG: hypothetical protein CL916_01400 [Deltaproteobacteria bacterium]|nr:hypothetical protein [Deltaproteobacteria bacterium]
MLIAENVQYNVGAKVILDSISIQIPLHKMYVIIGPNGSGKSSLLRCLSGWNIPSAGLVRYGQEEVSGISAKRRASIMSFLPQRPRMTESIPIVDVIAAARYRFSESHRESKLSARALLEENHLGHLEDRDWDTLSGGEAQRIALLTMKAQDADLWILDEPANHLDPAVQKEMYQSLIHEWNEGRTMIVVTHNINLILAAVPTSEYERVAVMGLDEGKMQFERTLSDPDIVHKIGDLYQLPIQTITAFGKKQFIFGSPQ